MNKYEKAFNHLREHASFDTVDEMIDIKELVEKATPKKPLIAFAAGAAAFVPAKAGKPCRQRGRGAGHGGRGAGRTAKDEPAPQTGSANAGKAHAHPRSEEHTSELQSH